VYNSRVKCRKQLAKNNHSQRPGLTSHAALIHTPCSQWKTSQSREDTDNNTLTDRTDLVTFDMKQSLNFGHFLKKSTDVNLLTLLTPLSDKNGRFDGWRIMICQIAW